MPKLTIRAKKDAPDFLQMGDLTAEKKDGEYRLASRDFADWIIKQNYGHEANPKPASTDAKNRRAVRAEDASANQPPNAPIPADAAVNNASSPDFAAPENAAPNDNANNTEGGQH